MNEFNRHQQMILRVARAMGGDLLQKMAFVGGCTTGLLLTDAHARRQVRHTEDVDLIVHVLGHVEWDALQQRLRANGFRDQMAGDAPICAMELDGLRVDFMPDDPKLLGFGNRWYADALRHAQDHVLRDAQGEVTIRLVAATYFIATKFEAYRGRGRNDPLGSGDVEDILNLFDGRVELPGEISRAPEGLRRYIAEQLAEILGDGNFDYAVQSVAQGNQERENLLFERLEAVAHAR